MSGNHEVELHWQGRTALVVTENLSLKGMLCLVPAEMPVAVGDECLVRLPLSPDAVIEIEARAVRVDEVGNMALDFEAMDPDSFAHLRNVVRYAAADPDAIDEEIGTPSSGSC